jgi:hypothetical protein
VFAVIREIMRLAVPLALEGDRPQRKPPITEHEDDIGPLMPHDIPLAVMERVGVFRLETGAVLSRPVDDEHDLPGQPVEACERLGKLPGLWFGEPLQRGKGHLGMRLQHSREESFVHSGKPGSFFEGRVRGDDHQKAQRAGAKPLKPLTDGDPTCAPSLYGASEHRAAPRCEYAQRGGGDDSIGKGSGGPRPFGQEVIGGIPGPASL